MKRYKRNNKAITLIALVVTIVVLLILAGVSIGMLAGENGIIKQAQDAKESTEIESEKEIINLAVQAAKENGYGAIIKEKLQDELNKLLKGEVEVTGNGPYTVTYKESGRTYNVEQNGNASEVGNSNEYVGLIVTPETEGITLYTDKDGNAKELTETVANGDVLIYGGYEYRYNERYFHGYEDMVEMYWTSDTNINGWGVKCVGENYGELCREILGKQVTNLDGTFGGKDLEMSPEIPNTITSMKNTYFQCKNLKKAPQIPEKVTILESTFEECKNLTDVVIPNGITNIGFSTFRSCEKLQNLIIPDSVEIIEAYAFQCCEQLKSLKIPDSVIDIKSSAFNGCDNLEYVELSNLLTYISNQTFRGCINLKSIEIPKNVTIIFDGAFMECTSLKSIVIPNNVTEIARNTFLDCVNLESIKYEGTVEQWKNILLGNSWAKNVKTIAVECTDGSVNI